MPPTPRNPAHKKRSTKVHTGAVPAGEPAPPPNGLVRNGEPEPGSLGFVDVAGLRDSARGFMAASSSPATRRAYASDWRTFTLWCTSAGFTALPASVSTLVLYFTHLANAGKKASTIERARSAISIAHETGAPSTTNPARSQEVRIAMKGIRRTIGTAPKKKSGVLGDDLEKMVSIAGENPEPLRGARDAALLALGFAGGFRRSELVAMEVGHLSFEREGLRIFIPKSKTDQEGKGRWIGTTHSPTIALIQRWLKAANIKTGRVFRSVQSGFGKTKVTLGVGLSTDAVADIVKKYAGLIGYNIADFSGHSLRRGFITTAKRHGKNNDDIMRTTGHKSFTVFQGYIEEASVFQNNASADLWGMKK